MMPAYKDIEGDPIRISFSNVENFLLAQTFTARPINVYNKYTEYALVSEPVAIGENAIAGTSTITITFTDMTTG